MKRIMILALSIFAYSLSFGQAYGEIHGKAFFEDGSPVMFANVWVDVAEVKNGTMTDENGKYKIKPLLPGTYDVHISYLGAETILQGVEVFPDEIAFADNMTVGDPTTMIEGGATIEVQGEKLINPEEMSKITIKFDKLRNTPGARSIVGAIQVMSSEVKVSADGSELYFRGSRGGNTQYIVDGVKVIGPAPKIPSSGVSRLSVYTGGVPAKYGDCIGGYVVIETKSFTEVYNQRKADALAEASRKALH